MKKLFVLAIAILTMVSCGDEVEFNSPAMQGKKDGTTWKAVSYRAYIDENGKSIITGHNNYETINLQVSSFSVGTYLLGESNSNIATLIGSNLEEYSTNNLPDQDIELYPPDGIIEITEFNQVNNSISGKFWFNAYSASGTQTVNFSQGIFYNIPIPFSSGPGLMSCDEAVAATATAAELYNATNPSDANFATVCNGYKNALMDQQVACGDDTGILQGIIDGLDCDVTSGGDYLYHISGEINGEPFVYGRSISSPIADYTQAGFGNSITTECAYNPVNGGLNYACGVYPNLSDEARPSIYFDFIRFYLCSSTETAAETFNDSFPVTSYDFATSSNTVTGSTGDVLVSYTVDSTDNSTVYTSIGTEQTGSYFEITSSTENNTVVGSNVIERKQLIEGTFAVKLYNETTGDVMEITNGSFKLGMFFD